MNLWDIQPAIVTLLQGDTRPSGIPILADDGTYPKTPGHETAPAKKGVVLVVWEIESQGLVDATAAGLEVASQGSKIGLVFAKKCNVILGDKAGRTVTDVTYNL